MEAEISNFHKKMTPFLKIFYKKVKLCVAFSIFDSVFFLVKLKKKKRLKKEKI